MVLKLVSDSLQAPKGTQMWVGNLNVGTRFETSNCFVETNRPNVFSSYILG